MLGLGFVAAVAAAALAFVGPTQAAVGGPTCNVGTDYATIQAAVSDPGCTTVNVPAGTYNEQVQITHSLTLKGAQAGVDARTRSGAESVITNSCGPVQIMADNVVIDGFTIEGSTDGDPCFLSGIWSNPGFLGTNGGYTIVNNIVQNNISGIELDSTCAASPTLVQHNLIRNNSNPGAGAGNGIETNFGLCNATINANTFSGDTSSSVLVDTPSSNVNVTNNQLVAGAAEGIAFLGVSNSTISGNVSLGTASSGTIDLFGSDSNVAVTGNVLANGMRGIQVENPYSIYGAVPNTGITAHTNCISGNAAAGLEEDSGGHSGTLNATSNWWGKSSGPTIASNPSGSGDVIIDSDGVVAYSPFTTSQPAAPCPTMTPRDLKQGVLATLQGIGHTGNKDTDKKIADAISHLQNSLNPSLWVDGSHLDPKKGDKVFDEEKAAVDSLTDIKKPSPSLAATIASSVQTLTSADRSLATTAISESSDPKKIAAANKELAAGDKEASKGHFEQAIDHYKNAWKQVQKP